MGVNWPDLNKLNRYYQGRTSLSDQNAKPTGPHTETYLPNSARNSKKLSKSEQAVEQPSNSNIRYKLSYALSLPFIALTGIIDMILYLTTWRRLKRGGHG